MQFGLWRPFLRLNFTFCFCELPYFRITSSLWCRPHILLTTHHPLMLTTAHFPFFDGGRLPLFCSCPLDQPHLHPLGNGPVRSRWSLRTPYSHPLYSILIWQRVLVWLKIHHGSLWARGPSWKIPRQAYLCLIPPSLFPYLMFTPVRNLCKPSRCLVPNLLPKF